MQKVAKLVINYFKQAGLTFLCLLIVFVCVMGGHCLSINITDTLGCFLLSIIYFFPSLWLILFISLELLKKRNFLTKKWGLLLLLWSVLYVIIILLLSLLKAVKINDLSFAGLVLSIYIISFIFLRLLSGWPEHEITR